ncbi:hypothetical protein L1887_20522 [Cichorium endivia]|nr:hypothetical protein L1887_20522 [Cichorium endivia]
MQEYRITEKCKNDVKDDRALCRVFLVAGNRPEMGSTLTGDYLELNDLVDDPGSRSFSSVNSSCLTMTSDEYFDHVALLQQLEDDAVDEKMNDSSVNFNLSAPVNSKLVICPVTSVYLKSETSKAKKEAMNESIVKEGKKETKRHKIMKYFCFLAF